MRTLAAALALVGVVHVVAQVLVGGWVYIVPVTGLAWWAAWLVWTAREPGSSVR